MTSVPFAYRSFSLCGAPGTLTQLSEVTKTRSESGSSSCALETTHTNKLNSNPKRPTCTFTAFLKASCLLRTNRRANHPHLRAFLDNLERVSLQWTHLHHLLGVVPQHG